MSRRPPGPPRPPPTGVEWTAWAPPLDPPEDGGLDRGTAERIARRQWGTTMEDHHCAAAAMWDAYAATLAPEPAVRAVSTGAQSVTYDQAAGIFGLAVARAEWHRSFCGGGLASVPLRVAPLEDDGGDQPVDWWQRDLEDPP
jgi:hypothetical protein